MINPRKEVLNFLEENTILSLATCDRNQPWICVLLFVNDTKFNFYFISDQKARHSREISKNSKVAFAINHEKEQEGYIKALQIEGVASKLPLEHIPRVLKMYLGKFPFSKNYLPSVKKAVSKAFRWKFYKIETTKIYYMDKKLFDEGRREEFVI